ncbi:hypothetical protein BASA81_006009 [Batrachochytrium salamandrivorans]|nr:hypothetical protein BASA81_006009 [Batrachochytrium salamandrivorans]
MNNYSRQQIQQPSTPTTSTPVQQHRTTDDMDIDFARRGPLTTTERQQRTVPLQLHIGKHVETATFYVTDLCHGFILGYSWLERHNPRINWVSRMVEFDSPYCLENCCDGSSRIQGLGKPPDISKTLNLLLLRIPSRLHVDLSPISCSLSNFYSLESMQSDVYPFVEVSPASDASVPLDILSSFSSLFSEDQAETLPPHRVFDCSIDLKPASEPFHGKIYQLTREEDKSCKNGLKTTFEKDLFETVVLHMAHHASL